MKASIYSFGSAFSAAYEGWGASVNLPSDPASTTPHGDSLEYRFAEKGSDFRFPGAANTAESGFSAQYVDYGGPGGLGRVWLFFYSAINGGAGDDTLIGFDDTVGDEIRAVYAGLGGTTAIAGMELYATGDDFLMGDVGDDLIQGRGGQDVLMGGIGDDTIEGGAGDDLIDGGNGTDHIDGGTGFDRVHYNDSRAAYTINVIGSGSYTITRNGTEDIDTLLNIEMVTFNNSQPLFTEDHDYINFDSLSNGQRDLIVAFPTDIYDSLGDSDTVMLPSKAKAGLAPGVIWDFTKAFKGGAGNDTITGKDGDDNIEGGAGNDTIDGGAGEDTAHFGGPQADYVIVNSGGGSWQITKIGANGTDTDILTNVEKVKFNGVDYAPPLVRFKSIDAVTEGDSGFTTIAVKIGIDIPQASPFSFVVKSAPGTARNNPFDFMPVNSVPVNIDAFGTEASFNVRIIGDKWPELTETFTLEIVGAKSAGPATVTINDDDGPYTWQHVTEVALMLAPGDTLLAKASSSWPLIQDQRRADVSGTNTVYRDAEYYLYAYDAGINGKIGQVIAAALGLPLYNVLKLIFDMRVNPDNPTTPPGGWTPTWKGLYDGLKAGGLPRLTFADGDNTSATTDAPANGGVVFAAGGDDTVKLGKGPTLVDGGDGIDTASYAPTAPAGAAAAPGDTGVFVNLLTGEAYHSNGQDGLTGIENVTGAAGANALVGDGGANRLEGGAGSDTIFGGHWSGAQPTGDDVLLGGGGDDGLWGFDGVDMIDGGDGSDGLLGGAGDDALAGGGGNDFLFGGDFTPAGGFASSSGNDALYGGDGDDGIWGFDGHDLIKGEAGNDVAFGGDGDDTIEGGGGNDYLIGEAGGDIVKGGAGFDYIYGGDGADTFVFERGDSADWVLDFSAAQGDRLRFEGFGFASFAAIPLVDLSTPGNLVVQLTFVDGVNVDQLTVFGVTLAQLNATSVTVV